METYFYGELVQNENRVYFFKFETNNKMSLLAHKQS